MKPLYLSITIVILSFILALAFYSMLPENIITHWNANGDADGSSNKFIGLFLIPLISLALLILLYFIPKLDPLRKNINKFKRYYEFFILLLELFLLYMQFIVILANLGYIPNIIAFLAPAMGILFFFIGVLIEKSKRNWFIGIRTPWTMSNDKVWHKTHALGGKLFKISGIIAILGVFFRDLAFFFIIVPVILSSIYLVIYSYLEYKKLKDNNSYKHR